MNRDELKQIALNPGENVVVEACAGSGKTWLLVSRILRQLLAGAAPSEILAITFTRKAAHEMQSRLLDWLDALARLEESQAIQFLIERGLTITAAQQSLPRARQLRDLVAYAAPGLTITTFHGWFQQLLSQAPLPFATSGLQISQSEWALLDEAWQRFGKLLAESRANAGDSEHTQQRQALARLFSQFGLESTRKLLNQFIHRRAEWHLFVQHRLQLPSSTSNIADVLDAALTLLASQFSINPQEKPLTAWHTGIRAPIVQFAQTLATIKSEAAQRTANELEIASRESDPALCLTAIQNIFLTQSGSARKNLAAWAEKAGVETQYRELYSALETLTDLLLHQTIWQQNADALTAGIALLEQYEAIKREQQVLDFSDLEWRAYALLSDSVHAETMQYKLDCRYRHILLDEFQDTNPLQWLILRCWLDASVAADNRPGIFMVGDPKQAIYRFRRADSRLFDFCRDYFVSHFDAHICNLNRTYRNAPAIVSFVNGLFTEQPDFAGFIPHHAERTHLPGLAQIISAFSPDTETSTAESESPRSTPAAWRNPLTTPRTDDDDRHRHQAEAEYVVSQIQKWVSQLWVTGEDGQSRTARYGDIKILFRQRTHLQTYQAALRAADIPYTGAKPGGLLGTLEASDLSALLRFLATPDDNLALAHALKSPLFALTDIALCHIADQPNGSSWWQKLQHLPCPDPATLTARAHLNNWLTLIDRLPTHDVLDRIYHQLDIHLAYQRAVPQAMRRAVSANLDAFMQLALQVDSGRYPSLQRFLLELKAFDRLPDQDSPDEGELSHGADGENNAVELLTIHAAKGLEAPIVWLVDCARAPSKQGNHTLLMDWPPGESAPVHFSFYTTKDFRGNARTRYFASNDAIAERENMNLLYVAVTRAKQFFLMSGTANRKKSDSLSWLERAEQIIPTATTNNHAHLDLSELSNSTPPPNLASLSALSSQQATPITSPDADAPLAPLLPTKIGQRISPATTNEQNFGIAVHAWLEKLSEPQLSNLPEAPQDAADALAHLQASQILASPALQHFYRGDAIISAKNELEFTYLNQGIVQIRRIDRLVEFQNEIWILDYKTGAIADRLAEYQMQLEEYKTGIALLYPGKIVRTALIDQQGKLHELSRALL